MEEKDIKKEVCEKEVTLLDRKYLAYLKEVPSRIAAGKPISTVIRAFIREIKR